MLTSRPACLGAFRGRVASEHKVHRQGELPSDLEHSQVGAGLRQVAELMLSRAVPSPPACAHDGCLAARGQLFPEHVREIVEVGCV